MKKLILLLLTLLPFSALAITPENVTPENLDLKYEAYWSGIKAGDMHVVIAEKPDSFNDTVDVNSVGVVQTITKYWNKDRVKGAIKNAKYVPEDYHSVWQQKKNTTQEIVVSYGKNGEVTEFANPAESRSKHPEVLAKDKDDTLDPVLAGITARVKVRQIIESKGKLPQKFSIKMFDGRRVSNLSFNIIGYQDRKIDGKVMKLLKITMDRVPLAGFNIKELSKLKEYDPVIDIYADDNFIPVYAIGHAIIGEFTIKKVN